MNDNTGENLPLANVIRAGNTVYVSGQVPLDGDRVLSGGGIEAQIDLVLDNLEAAFQSKGARLSDVVKTTVFLTNVKREFHGMNAVYARRFDDTSTNTFHGGCGTSYRCTGRNRGDSGDGRRSTTLSAQKS